ncbi:MAG: hydroxyethylthiazole kinase [Pseudomonadota bacterium]
MVNTPPKENKIAQLADEAWGRRAADVLERFRARRPHVHCLTNIVAQNFTANVLLAAGATPSMTINPVEIDTFVGMADAVLINLGTLDDERMEAIHRAVLACQRAGKDWALDPVFVQASPIRQTVALECLRGQPTLVRANAAERKVLGKSLQDTAAVLAVTGKIDCVQQGDRSVSIQNGVPMMDRVTAMGCALTAVAVGFCAVEDDKHLATAAALSFFGVAGEWGLEQMDPQTQGPGTFASRFLDALALVTPKMLEERARISEEDLS